MNVPFWINTLWMLSCRREARAFGRATERVAQSQRKVFREIVTNNSHTVFGQQHGFSSIQTVSDFQRRIPISTYDDYSTSVDQIAIGQDNILTAEKVELLEPTSGTTTGEKLIPYTASLRRQFQRAVAAWIADVMRSPDVRRGRAYWSISPAMGGQRETPGGIPVGFDDDAAYLNPMERLFLKHLLVMPPGIARLTSIQNFRYATLFHLLAAGDLSLISVWSPTFLSSLFSKLDDWSERLLGDLHRGRIVFADEEGASVSEALLKSKCSKRRAHHVGNVLRSNDSLPVKLSQLWPQLELISCWADSTAGTYLSGIRECFPDVAIQPKGLMSTEACTSFPLTGHPGAALAVRSHFFEFFPDGGSANRNQTRLADQLDAGQQYEVVVTTGGGLYRYRTRDVVEVVGHFNECPLIRFVGRNNRISDLVGEKLDESHIGRVLQTVFRAHELIPRFAMMVPLQSPAGYRLYLELNEGTGNQAAMFGMLGEIESGMCENPHYQYALKLGQLQPLEIQVVDEPQARLWQTYERVLLARGQRAGEIKPAALDSWIGWEKEFESEKNNRQPSVAPIVE